MKGFDNGLFTGMILIDLQKAFDTIDHNILLEKLKAIGFCDDTVNWFHSYLTDRAFLVSIENKYSAISKISCGVPQGSILGPLLFLIYVNNMKQVVKSDQLLYADDSCFVFQHKHVTEFETHLYNDFSNLCEWFLDNKLSIHFGEDTTKSILFGAKCELGKIDKLNPPTKVQILSKNPKLLIWIVYLMRMSVEPMANKTIKKINSSLNYVCRKKALFDATSQAALAQHIDSAAY